MISYPETTEQRQLGAVVRLEVKMKNSAHLVYLNLDSE